MSHPPYPGAPAPPTAGALATGPSMLAAIGTLLAAALGACAAGTDPPPIPPIASLGPRLVAAIPSPDDILAYGKAIVNVIGILVNTIVGAAHVIRIGRERLGGRRRKRRAPRRPAPRSSPESLPPRTP